jgi:c-di-GMP-binding flagellar brake protein YcgR
MLDRFGRLDTRDVQNLVRMNSAILPPGSATGEMRGVGAVRIGRHGRISRGWLLVLSSGALFLSLGGQVEDRCYLEGPLIDRSRSGVKDEGILHIVVERREERFAICGGQKTAATMWKALWNHLPDMQSMAARFPFLDAITGRVGYVRLSHRQLEILARRMVTTRLERDGIGFAVGDQAPDLLAPGLDVEVEMGNQEVVYCFRTHVARVDDPSNSNYVVIGLSSNVKRRDNRREAFRVALEEEVSVFRKQSHLAQHDGEAIPATIANLSWTGLSLLIDQTLPSGTLLAGLLELEGAADQYTFEVVHTRKLPGESRILHGCRILDLSAGQQDHIQSAVIRQQMREVYAQEFGDPAQDDPSPGNGRA